MRQHAVEYRVLNGSPSLHVFILSYISTVSASFNGGL